MPQCSQKETCLYDCTTNPGDATTEPGPQPKPGTKILWYRDTKPRFYAPYLVRVSKRDASTMSFVFLNAETGEDLELSKDEFVISYHDGRYAHSDLPSTAQLAEHDKPERSFGLLFISDTYIKDQLTADDWQKVKSTSGGDGKWPYGAASLHNLLRLQPGDRIDQDTHRDLQAVLNVLQSLASWFGYV